MVVLGLMDGGEALGQGGAVARMFWMLALRQKVLGSIPPVSAASL